MAAITVPMRTHGVHTDAARDSIPVLLGLAPIGFVLGVTIAASSIDGIVGWAGGPLVLSGAAHFALLSLLDAGAGAGAAILTAVAISSRNALYSAALSGAFADQPRWFRWVAPYFLVDQNFAMADERRAAGETSTRFRHYYLTLSVLLWVMWSTTIGIGMLVGPVVPDGWRIELSAVILVTAMLRPALTDRVSLVAAGIAVAVTVVAAPLPNGSGLPLAALVAMVVARRVERSKP